ncbi:Hypothetical predicted protein [Mytilus galloprovincialis]|uniref:Uncharacterized protein n=1 Tax=Mytilus galloprovincialis TaxID=29158 RepID=A0A8B6C186_MYTGA|nr:Hypothetical predicted protein [Mytilus galloprovincialis]
MVSRIGSTENFFHLFWEKEKEDAAMKEIELVRLRREVHRLKAENRRLTAILMANSQEKETEVMIFLRLYCKVHNGWLQEDISSEVFEATVI